MYSKTATQFEFMMKTAMIMLFVFGLFIFFVDITKAAQWVNNPANCAIQSPGGEVVCQTSETPNSRVCGVSGVQYYCYSSVAVFVAPGDIQNNNASQSSLGGGYIMNCEANDSAPPSGPFCDNNTNFWCNSDISCNNKNRITQCASSKWAYETSAFSCGVCISTHLDCGGDDTCEIIKNITPSTTVPNTNYGNTCDAVVCQSGYGNCDSDLINGCEIQFGVSSCTTGGGEPGVFTACGVCTALPPKNFLTASNTDYYSDNPLLWGTQLGSGDLINFGNATSSNIFVVKNDASVFMSSTLATTTDQYFYNYNGDLYWGETKLNTGGGVYTAGSGLNLDGYEFTVSTTQDFTWDGQHNFKTTTTFPFGVWGSDGKVGIGTSTPSYSLTIVADSSGPDGLTIFNNSGQMMAGIGVGNGGNAGLALYNAFTGNMDVSLNSDYHSWINNSHNFGIGTSSPDSKLTIVGDVNIAESGLLRFNGISGSVDQVIKINLAGFPEWVDVSSLFANNTTFNSSTDFNSTSTFNSSTEFYGTSTFYNTAIFNNPSIFNDNVFVSGTIYSENLTVYGTTTLNDIFVTGQSIFHDILPETNLIYNIGTSSAIWKEGWFGEIFTNEISFINNWKLTTTSEGGLAFVSSTQTALAILTTGQIGINTTTVEANLQMKVDGNIGSKLYCDVNGNNCFDPSNFGWSMPQARYMNTTTADYNGNFGSYGVASGTVGYEAANHICSSTVGAGYHICQANEILDIIRIYGTSTFVGKINGWVANGPPGYVTVSTNDCEGYTSASGLSYGAWWKYNDNNGGGSGKMISCNSSMPISCCK